MKRIVAISDNHGILSKKLREDIGTCDVLLIAGDTADLYKQKSMDGSKWWYKENFLPWLSHVDAKHIVMVAGNHDFWLESHADDFRKMIEGTNITYLENEYVEIDGVTIYGTPLCHKFYNWAFMPSDEKQEEIYKSTMDDRHIDILLAHDAPYGCSDVCFKANWPVEDPHIGSHVLRKVRYKMKKISIQSMSDIITNSSSEVFVIQGGSLTDAIVRIVKDVTELWCNTANNEWLKEVSDILDVEVANDFYDDSDWGYHYNKGDIVIYSTEDNSIPYDLMEALEDILNALGVKWQRRHLG